MGANNQQHVAGKMNHYPQQPANNYGQQGAGDAGSWGNKLNSGSKTSSGMLGGKAVPLLAGAAGGMAIGALAAGAIGSMSGHNGYRQPRYRSGSDEDDDYRLLYGNNGNNGNNGNIGQNGQRVPSYQRYDEYGRPLSDEEIYQAQLLEQRQRQGQFEANLLANQIASSSSTIAPLLSTMAMLITKVASGELLVGSINKESVDAQAGADQDSLLRTNRLSAQEWQSSGQPASLSAQSTLGHATNAKSTFSDVYFVGKLPLPARIKTLLSDF